MRAKLRDIYSDFCAMNSKVTKSLLKTQRRNENCNRGVLAIQLLNLHISTN